MKAAQQLCEKQEEMGMAEHILVQDMPTRWNSTLEMVARLVEQKDMLKAMMSTTPILPGGRKLNISATNWLTPGQIVDILKPFEETTKILCSLDASLAHAIPLIHALHRGLNALNEDDSSLLLRNRALVMSLTFFYQPCRVDCFDFAVTGSTSWHQGLSHY
ncbi:hypothetical protein JRQ81_015135 [Phrynocephalus forsythii]|uniref:Zinc finger BED domain-containing protein 4 n=1 Tax=Phrynocephalus forsythii TaxID=171643 RepID=A0A9Q1B462_9SAUR|nr:hypothetical protein JRQ81_015135 [Phrynocephalus forsythii]